MTKREDKLVSIAGIEEIWRSRTQQAADRCYSYRVFEEDIERTLLWYAPNKVEMPLERALS